MTCWALVPIKARIACKTRLRDRLGTPARRELARDMLAHVLGAVAGSGHVNHVVVVSPERDQVPSNVLVIVDDGEDLNAALDAGRAHALSRGARELLVLAADLPEVTTAEIDRLIMAGRRSGVAIAPDRAGTGTNALFLASPADFTFCFGADSRTRHEQESRKRDIAPALCRLPGLAADLDTGEDLERWLVTSRWAAVARVAGERR